MVEIKTMETIKIEVDSEVYDALKQMAKFENMKVEQLASELLKISFYLEDEEKTNETD